MSVKKVKSVARVFEILELYEREQKPLEPIYISQALGYPIASTHEILKTMKDMGYFVFGDPKWTYRPAGKIATIVEWVRENIRDDENMMKFMQELNIATKETINLSIRSVNHVRITQGLESLNLLGVSSKVGTVMEIIGTLTGLTALSHLDDSQLNKFLADIVKSDNDQFSKLDMNLLKSIRNEIIQTGMVMKVDVAIPGIGAICFPVNSAVTKSDLVIGVVGPSDRIIQNVQDYKKSIKALVKKYNIKTRYPIK